MLLGLMRTLFCSFLTAQYKSESRCYMLLSLWITTKCLTAFIWILAPPYPPPPPQKKKKRHQKVLEQLDTVWLIQLLIYRVIRLIKSFTFAFWTPPEERLGMSDVCPLVWNLRAVIWFHFTISSLVLLPSPITLSVLSFFCLLVHFPELFPENSSNIFR